MISKSHGPDNMLLSQHKFFLNNYSLNIKIFKTEQINDLLSSLYLNTKRIITEDELKSLEIRNQSKKYQSHSDINEETKKAILHRYKKDLEIYNSI